LLKKNVYETKPWRKELSGPESHFPRPESVLRGVWMAFDSENPMIFRENERNANARNVFRRRDGATTPNAFTS
jgi:hypothetical protein